MENNHGSVSRQWLESLSTDELIKLADTNGIDIPSGLERIFIIEELLEVSNANEQEITEDIEVNPSYSETAPLPKQYNISFIDVIIRDPLWVFVFWEVKGQDRELYENSPNFNGYCIRIIPLDENGEESKNKEHSYTVSVSTDDCARYLGLTEHPANGACSSPENTTQQNGYKIKLGVIRGESEIQIAASAPFYLPKLINRDDNYRDDNDNTANVNQKVLQRLSGLHDLSIIKNTDRQSRIKRL